MQVGLPGPSKTCGLLSGSICCSKRFTGWKWLLSFVESKSSRGVASAGTEPQRGRQSALIEDVWSRRVVSRVCQTRNGTGVCSARVTCSRRPKRYRLLREGTPNNKPCCHTRTVYARYHKRMATTANTSLGVYLFERDVGGRVHGTVKRGHLSLGRHALYIKRREILRSDLTYTYHLLPCLGRKA